ILRYTGNFTDYLEKRCEEEKAEKADAPKETAPRVKQEKLKFSFKEQREFDGIDAEIAALEEKLQLCTQEIAQFGDDYVKLQEILARQENLTAALDEKMERWIYLNDLAERIEAQKAEK
ncbi:MAG: ABC transporter C-terminal domain-containing protein, partial [Ruthenibacterium sp.]